MTKTSSSFESTPRSTTIDPRISPTLMRRATRRAKPPTPPSRPSPRSLFKQTNMDYQALAKENMEEKKKSKRLEKLYESICEEMKRQHVITCETKFKYESLRLTSREMRERILELEKERRERDLLLERERKAREHVEAKLREMTQMKEKILRLEKDRKCESKRECERIISFGTYGAYRQILGISRHEQLQSNTEKIKKRFRYLAKLVHPDKCRDYDSKKAFQILKDAFDRMSENPSLESKPSWKTLYRENHLKDEEIRSLRNENSKLKAQTLFRRQQQRRAPVETKSTTPPVINRRRRKKRTPPRRGHTRSLFQDENIINGVCRNTGMVCKNCAAGRGCRWAGRGLPGHC